VRELRDSIDDPDAVAMNAMLIAETVQETSMAMLARAHGAEPALLSAYQRWAPKATTRLLNEPEETTAANEGELSYTGKAPADRAAAACITALRRARKSLVIT